MTKLSEAVDQAQHIVFLTGAGVSTASGIPDFRSANGLYSEGDNPEYLLSQACLANEPQKFYDYVKDNLYYPKAQPNVIHQKMAALVNRGHALIITQNIDGLDLKAGANPQGVVEFHGDLYQVYCQKCGQTVPWQDYLEGMHHQDCGGILRPDIVLYGEGIKQEVLEKSVLAVSHADLIVVVGTSLVVYPFAGLLEYWQPKAKVIAINKTKIAVPKGSELILGDARDEFVQL